MLSIDFISSLQLCFQFFSFLSVILLQFLKGLCFKVLASSGKTKKMGKSKCFNKTNDADLVLPSKIAYALLP